MRKVLLTFALSLFAISAFAGGASEQQAAAPAATGLGNYPSRPIQFVVNRGAGGGTDVIARSLATALQRDKGIATAVINVEGGDGLIGANQAMRAPADGYNLMVLGSSEIPNILVNYSDGATFTADDVVPIVQLATRSTILVVKPNSPFQTLDDFVAYARANPGRLTVAIPGVNKLNEPLMLEDEFGIDVTPVNSGGGAAAYRELLGGHVEAALLGSQFLDNARSEGMVVLADMANRQERVADQPDSFLSMGYDIVSESFTYVIAPRGISPDIVAFLSSTIQDLFVNGDLEATLLASNQAPMFMGNAEFAPYHDRTLLSTIELMRRARASM